jgi:signal transduction histidine kinase
MVLSITLPQIAGVILRYIPFSKLITPKQLRTLIYRYVIWFMLQNIILFIAIRTIHVNPSFYKIVIFIGAFIYVFINFTVIKKMFFQHAFILGMQTCYSLVLHSIAAIILSKFSHALDTSNEIILQSFIFLILFILTLYPLWKFVRNSFILNISSEYSYYWNIIWLIPNLLWISDVIITMDNSWISTWRQLVARLLMGASILVSYKCVNLDFKELKEKFELNQINKLLHIQMDTIKHQSKTINENDEKMRIFRHDMRHNVQMLSQLINNGEISDALSILSQLNDTLENTKPILFCKNPIINSALLVYIHRAQEENIEIISEIDIPKNIPWNNNDMAILFANTLENAINASRNQARDKKEIRITTKYFDKKLAIVIENRFDGEVLFSDAGMPISTREGHGIGMNSILSIVSKYNGQVICSHSDNWFTIRFMFSENLINK